MNNRNWIKKLNNHQKQYIELIDKPYIGLTEDDQHMRKMEMEAYLKGNLLLRDFEDNFKY